MDRRKFVMTSSAAAVSLLAKPLLAGGRVKNLSKY
jgi:hypothetical protein